MNGITLDDAFPDDKILELALATEPHDFERIAPPAQVWDNILAEVEVERASAEADARRRFQPWFRSNSVLAIAAATLLMVGVVAAVAFSRDNDVPTRELAAAQMTDVDLPVATDETAQARVVCGEDGCAVELWLSGLPDAGDGDLELWVINSDVSDMHSLGIIDGANAVDGGSYALPAGVTPDDFPIVDISVEPRDGDETHSGQSVLRGVLEA